MFGCLGLEGKKGRDSVNTTGMDQGRRYCLMFCTTQWMQRHTTSHQENKIRDIFSGGQVAGRQKPAHHVKLARSLVIRIPHKRGIRDSVATFSSVLRGFGYLCAYPKHRHMECITPEQTDTYILKETGQPI